MGVNFFIVLLDIVISLLGLVGYENSDNIGQKMLIILEVWMVGLFLLLG